MIAGMSRINPPSEATHLYRFLSHLPWVINWYYMFGKLNPEEIEQLLGSQLVGRIGCHADGLTYVVPVSYAYEAGSIYIHSLDGMKLDMMRKNPQVCFEVDDTRNLANWKTVISWGVFEEFQTDEEKQTALDILNNRILPILSSETMHITPEWPFPVMDKQTIPGVFYRIRLTEKTGRFEKGADDFYFAT